MQTDERTLELHAPRLHRRYELHVDPEEIARLIATRATDSPGLEQDFAKAETVLRLRLRPELERFEQSKAETKQELAHIQVELARERQRIEDTEIPKVETEIARHTEDIKTRRGAFYAAASAVGIKAQPDPDDVVAKVATNYGLIEEGQDAPKQRERLKQESKHRETMITLIFAFVTGSISMIAIGELLNLVSIGNMSKWSLMTWLGATAAACLGIAFAYLFHHTMGWASRLIYSEFGSRRPFQPGARSGVGLAIVAGLAMWVIFPIALTVLDTHGLQKGLDEHRALLLRQQVGQSARRSVPQTPIALTAVMAMALTAGLLWAKGVLTLATCRQEEDEEIKLEATDADRAGKRKEVARYFATTGKAAEALRLAQDIRQIETGPLEAARIELADLRRKRTDLNGQIKTPPLPPELQQQLDEGLATVRQGLQEIEQLLSGGEQLGNERLKQWLDELPPTHNPSSAAAS